MPPFTDVFTEKIISLFGVTGPLRQRRICLHTEEQTEQEKESQGPWRVVPMPNAPKVQSIDKGFHEEY
jgi:hypothetical protein